MTNKKERNRELPSNFVVYDSGMPSPLFSPSWVSYIESISSDFSEEELEEIRKLEQFTINTNTGLVGNGGIPGLREDVGKLHLYVGRTSAATWQQFVKEFMACIPDSFSDKNRCFIDMCRLSLPDGCRFYPFSCSGDLKSWDCFAARAAAECGINTGRFSGGWFNTSDGNQYAFSSLKWNSLAPRQPVPANW